MHYELSYSRDGGIWNHSLRQGICSCDLREQRPCTNKARIAPEKRFANFAWEFTNMIHINVLVEEFQSTCFDFTTSIRTWKGTIVTVLMGVVSLHTGEGAHVLFTLEFDLYLLDVFDEITFLEEVLVTMPLYFCRRISLFHVGNRDRLEN